MITYHTKQFSPSLLETIADWFNAFEGERNGRPFASYWIQKVSWDVLPNNSVLITIATHSND